MKDFGPDRPKQVYADVAEANAFVGDYLRLELLYLDGQYEKVLADIERQKSEHEAQIETLAQLSEAHRKQFTDHLEKVKTNLAEQESIVRLLREKQEDFHVAQEK